MAGRIPQSFIDELIARIDIVDVIDRRVPLKKAGGGEFKACCPFHNEKTPSFTVSAAKQFYHCFGCGAHGTALGFLMEYESLDFPEAVEELAFSIGLQVPREGGDRPRGDHGRHYQILEQAAEWFRAQLKAQTGRAAADYLKGRGVSGEIARDFGMGYAPGGYENLIAHFRGQARLDELKTVGLVSERESSARPYDKFRDRVMFPIRDRRGRTVGFGGRVLGDGAPKYLNSPETPVFHKGDELYGLYEVLKSGGRPERLLVVEGYMDVVALAQYGIRNAVAALGTNFTTTQIQRLFRTVGEVVFCFDGDRAGRQAAWKAMENALPTLGPSHQARFLFLPDGHDPDSLVREEGAAAFHQRMDQARPMLEYVFHVLEEEEDRATVEGRARLENRATPLIKSIQDDVLRDLMTQRLAESVRMDRDRIKKRLASSPNKRPNQRPATPTTRIDPARSPVRMIIALLLACPDLAETGPETAELAGIQRKGVDLMCELLEICRANPELNTASILERFRGHPAHAALERLASWDLGFTQARFKEEYDQTMRKLEEELDRQRIDVLLTIPKARLSADQADELRRLTAVRRN